MGAQNAKDLLAVTGGAVKFADFDAPVPTGPDFVFDPAIYKDLGALKTQPSLIPSKTTQTVTLWNMSDVTLGSSTSYTLSFGSAQIDRENVELFFNPDNIGTDGSFTPGTNSWSGQLFILLFMADTEALLWVPNATYTDQGTIDFLKNDLAELNSTFACNPDNKLNGAPWKFWPGKPLTPATPAE